MAAGSVIAAMAGIQDLDRMSRLPAGDAVHVRLHAVGGLALSGVPPFSGFFSKDEIIALLFARDDWHVVLGVLGYVGSLLTAIYTFRMIFRAFFGEPVPRRRGSSSTATCTTPSTRPTRRPARSRTPTSASRGPSTTSPSASSR